MRSYTYDNYTIEIICDMLKSGDSVNTIAEKLNTNYDRAAWLTTIAISKIKDEQKDLSTTAITKIYSLECELFRTIDEWNNSGRRDFKLQDKIKFLAMQYAYA